MSNPPAASSSPRPRLDAPQCGLALFKNSNTAADSPRGEICQLTRIRSQRAAILQAPSNTLINDAFTRTAGAALRRVKPALTMPVSRMATWLASDEQVLRTQLKSLECHGVVSCSEEAIRWLDPIKLETLWGV